MTDLPALIKQVLDLNRVMLENHWEERILVDGQFRTSAPKLARALEKAMAMVEAARRATYHEHSSLNLSCAHCAVGEALKAFDEAVD